MIKESDIITDFNGIYSGVPTKAFIQDRNRKAEGTDDTEERKYFRWDSEFPETDLPNHFDRLTWYDGIGYDLKDTILNNIDNKLYGWSGVKVSDWVQKQVKKEKIDYFLIWKWVTPWTAKLEEGKEYKYQVLGVVDAQEACKHLKKDNYENDRFRFPMQGMDH